MRDVSIDITLADELAKAKPLPSPQPSTPLHRDLRFRV